MLLQEVGQLAGVLARLADEVAVQLDRQHVPLRLDRARPARELGHQLVGGGVDIDAQEFFQPPQLCGLLLSDRDESFVLRDARRDVRRDARRDVRRRECDDDVGRISSLAPKTPIAHYARTWMTWIWSVGKASSHACSGWL